MPHIARTERVAAIANGRFLKKRSTYDPVADAYVEAFAAMSTRRGRDESVADGMRTIIARMSLQSRP